mgnify:CR=1 FL=1
MENLDISDLFTSELKSLFSKAKKFIIWSVPIGVILGALSGISSYQEDINGYLPEEAGSLSSYVLGNSFTGLFAGPLVITGLILLYVVFWFPSIVANSGFKYCCRIYWSNVVHSRRLGNFPFREITHWPSCWKPNWPWTKKCWRHYGSRRTRARSR